MKHLTKLGTLCCLALAVLALAVGGVAQAEEPVDPPATLEPALDLTPVPPVVQVDDEAVQADCEAVRVASLESMLSADECHACSSHQECNTFCGGFGSCVRDTALLCGNNPNDRYCACF